MLKGCTIFHPAWLLQMTFLWPLAPLVLHRLTFFAMMEHTQLEQIKVRATIPTSLKQLQTIHIAF